MKSSASPSKVHVFVSTLRCAAMSADIEKQYSIKLQESSAGFPLTGTKARGPLLRTGSIFSPNQLSRLRTRARKCALDPGAPRAEWILYNFGRFETITTPKGATSCRSAFVREPPGQDQKPICPGPLRALHDIILEFVNDCRPGRPYNGARMDMPPFKRTLGLQSVPLYYFGPWNPLPSSL